MIYMIAISIRVSEEMYAKLKESSEEHHRSVNGEVNHILDLHFESDKVKKEQSDKKKK
jgi:hypothetical protein